MNDYIINAWSDTNIKDKDAVAFINSIKSLKLRRIVRNHFENECYFINYTLKMFKEDFKEYLKDETNHRYFLPGLNDRTENILKKLLNI